MDVSGASKVELKNPEVEEDGVLDWIIHKIMKATCDNVRHASVEDFSLKQNKTKI